MNKEQFGWGCVTGEEWLAQLDSATPLRNEFGYAYGRESDSISLNNKIKSNSEVDYISFRQP